MKKICVLICLITLVSCSSTQKITQVEFDKNKRLYTGNVEGGGRVYLRDEHFNLIRNEENKDQFIKNYNAYWSLDQKYRTNDFYNHYYEKTSDFENLKNQNLMRNHEYSELYYSGIKKMKLTNYTEALKDFDLLIGEYPEIQYYSDILFLKAYCYEQLNDAGQAVSNYNQFINLSVQKYSSLFYEDKSINTNVYLQEIQYSYNALGSTNNSLPEGALSNDTVKYYNHAFAPGFNYYLPDNKIVQSEFAFGYDYIYGFMFGSSFLVSPNQFIDINPSIIFSPYFISATIRTPIQVFKSEDRRFGFEITPIISYSYFSGARLADDATGTLYNVKHDLLNFGFESSVGFYILPSLQAGLSYKYMYYNRDNPYVIKDQINGTNYSFSYWQDSFYYLSLRYYFFQEAGIEAAVKNNDFLIGIVSMYNFYIGYNINRNRLIASYYFF